MNYLVKIFSVWLSKGINFYLEIYFKIFLHEHFIPFQNIKIFYVQFINIINFSHTSFPWKSVICWRCIWYQFDLIVFCAESMSEVLELVLLEFLHYSLCDGSISCCWVELTYYSYVVNVRTRIWVKAKKCNTLPK